MEWKCGDKGSISFNNHELEIWKLETERNLNTGIIFKTSKLKEMGCLGTGKPHVKGELGWHAKTYISNDV